MQFLVLGAGAIGSYVGGSLAAHGHRSVFIERAGPAAEIERTGFKIRDATGREWVPAPSASRVVDSPAAALELGPFDVALLALKSFDIPSLIADPESILHRTADLPILCLSNGVENESRLSRVFGTERVIAGTVTTAVGRRAAGNVVVEKLRGTGVAAGHPRSQPLVEAMSDAELNARLYPRAADMKWSKLLTNLLANPSSAILDMTPAEIFADRRLYRLEVEQLREALRVMNALGIGVVDLPRTPVRLLALAVRLPAILSRPLLARAVGGGRGGKMPSFHIDLHSGRGLSEVDHLHGAVVRHGEQIGIATPVNRLLAETLTALTSGEIPIDRYARKPQKLIRSAARAMEPAR